VDVQADVLLGVLGLEEQHLRDDHVGDVVVDAADQEDHPFLQQARVDVVRALAAAGLLDHHGNQVQCLGLVAVHPIASWNVMGSTVCCARSAIRSITCSSIARLRSPAINWGSFWYNSMTCCGSS